MDDATNRRCDELMPAVARKDDRAIEELYMLTLETVLGCAHDVFRTKDEATLQDVSQEAFINIMKAVPNYSTDRGARFETWLRMIVTSKAIDMKRKARREKLEFVGASVERADRESTDVLMIREETELALSAIDDEEDRLAYVLKNRDGFTIEEIRKTIDEGVSVEAWKKRIQRAGMAISRSRGSKT